MLPPSSGTFTSLEELLTYIRTFTKSQGYVITIKRNRLNLTENSRHKWIASRLIECSFELFGTKHNNVWYLEIWNSEHNQEASVNMSGHSITQKLNIDQREQVKQMSAADSCPHQILSTIQQNNPFLMAISRTIYNTLYSIHQEKLNS
ncbi:23523_t:CDS:2 [Cetraspora pellucida]|uniref:23523_t:CDS:1 n=1 Tax=Cetraspora pellucida TaxID=1433469 RepID=A0A9N9AFA9_9GLOM|nr:23523_t:CDS:2 [Cetraspora pellucida]